VDSKLALALILVLLCLPLMVPENRAYDADFPHRQELVLPEVSDHMRYQPVDVTVSFVQPCWAVSEDRHSVRVVYDDGTAERELECQIYSLRHIDDSHIDSCNVVFLLEGEGRYYVYYSGQETAAPGYPDRVAVSDESYYYEPIPGYSINLDYYRITEEGDILYGVGQRGSFFGIDMSQKVIKQLPGKGDFRAANWGQLASFAFFWYEGRDKGTDEKLVSKDILVDGNLMVRVGIKSQSSDHKVETTALYTYYYSPRTDKRLTAEVTHEVLQSCRIQGMEEEDGIYAYLLTVQSRSVSLPDLNLGYIPPYLHVSAEDGTVHEYHLEQDPENEDYNWLLSTTDDIDLGSPAWFSIDDGATGRAYALMFNSTDIAPQLEGIQVKATTRQEVNVPGLEVDGGGISGGRNAYEAGGTHHLDIPRGFTATFIAQFYSSQDGGVESVKQEAQIFDRLVSCRKCPLGTVEGGAGKTHRLTVYPRLAPAVPFSSALSALTGRGLPSTTVELWRNDSLVAVGVASRIPIGMGEEGLPLDWKNASVRKKAVFPRLPPGHYVVRVRNGPGGRYVGVGVAKVTDNTSLQIWCGWQGLVEMTVVDQEGKGIPGVAVRAESQGYLLAVNSTDEQGRAVLAVPAPARFSLTTRYRGFLLTEEQVTLLLRHRTEVTTELYSLELTVRDTLDMPPGVSLSPVMSSNAMVEETLLTATQVAPGQYLFTDLPAAAYALRIRYKSFLLTRDVDIFGHERLEVTFPAAYALDIAALDARGQPLSGAEIVVSREGTTVTGSRVPPGTYDLVVRREGKVVGQRTLLVTEDRQISMVTTHQPLFPLLVTGLAAGGGAALLLWQRRRLSMPLLLLVLAGVLLAASLVQPWWTLTGDSAQLDVAARVFLIPARLVTTGEGPGVMNGEVASLPSLFTSLLYLVAILGGAGGVGMAAVLYLRRTWPYLPTLGALAGAVGAFTYGMGTAAEIITGSLWGSGTIDLSVPGSTTAAVHCSWSPGVGYHLALVSLLLVAGAFLWHLNLPKILKRR